MNKVVVITGPTASGKTSLAINLAKKFNSAIICVDSRSVYRGLDIGTAKPYIDKPYKKVHLRGVRDFGPIYKIDGVIHYGLNIVDPKNRYSVAEFQELAYKIIKDILKRGKIPFLVGGTGLFIDAITQGYQFPKQDLSLRLELEKKTTQDIIKQLKKIDPATVKKYKNNRRRLIRALEVVLSISRPLSEYKNKKPNFKAIIIAIDWPREKLYERIDKWVDMRLKMGLVEEVEQLHQNGLSLDRMREFGLEYRYLSNYLKNPTDEVLEIEMQKLKFKTHAFARRQLTWFRRNKNIHWIKAGEKLESTAKKLIDKFLNK